MTDLNDFITRYVATWNEPDPDVRRQWIAGTWSERTSLFNRIKEYHGHAGIEAAVGEQAPRWGRPEPRGVPRPTHCAR
jgi:hypothetical protein